jgi:DNA-binding CsgD family transcriptional regulator
MYTHTAQPATSASLISPPVPQTSDIDSTSVPLTHMLAHALDAFDELDYGIVIVDRLARVLNANHMARCLCAGRESVCQVQFDRLTARHSGDDHLLQHAVQSAASQGKRSLLTLGSEGRHESIAVVPLGQGPAVLLVFGKRQMCETLSVDHYARVHGLTHAEGMVLAALCDGDKPLEIAQRFGVAVSTVRTQIASIRQKTQTASIRDLVRRIAVLPPIVSALGRAQAH